MLRKWRLMHSTCPVSPRVPSHGATTFGWFRSGTVWMRPAKSRALFAIAGSQPHILRTIAGMVASGEPPYTPRWQATCAASCRSGG